MVEDKWEEPIICIREVNENIRRVETGQPLTRSLKILNTNCKFKKKYEEMDMIIHDTSEVKEKREARRVNHKLWQQRPGNKARLKEYQRKYWENPEVKIKLKEYRRKYNQKPGAKAKRKEYNKKYNQRPGAKARRHEYYLKSIIK